MTTKTLYTILEVAPNASPDTVAAAYQAVKGRLAQQSGPLADTRRIAIEEAYKTLSDPLQRARYDQVLAAKASPARGVAMTPAADFGEPKPWYLSPLAMIGFAVVVVLAALFYYKHEQRVEYERIAKIEQERREAEVEAKTKADEAKAEREDAERAARAEAGRRYDKALETVQTIQSRQIGAITSQTVANAERQAAIARQNEANARDRQEQMERNRADVAARQRLEEDKRKLQNLQIQNGHY